MTLAALPAVAGPPATAVAVPDIGTLADRLPAGTLLTEPASMERYSHDEAEWAPWALPAGGRPPDRRRAGAHHRPVVRR